jgi:hypothetical protein
MASKLATAAVSGVCKPTWSDKGAKREVLELLGEGVVATSSAGLDGQSRVAE